MVSIISMHSIAARVDDHSIKGIAAFCGVGLAASFCLIAFGLDFSAGWI
jgi:hypothetical protein